jgi:alkyl hydroperoxide reductase subunit F
MYDIIIIGAGPAGMTAAIYAARREMKTLVIGKEIGGQMIWASEIENYPAFESIKAFELVSRMQQQVKSLSVEIKTEAVSAVKPVKNGHDDYFIIETAAGSYKARTVVIAAGLVPKRLEVAGEIEFSGKGVSYCANCDGPFFKNRAVAVIGGGNSALDAAEVLSKIASKVFLVHRNNDFRGFESLIQAVKERENIQIMLEKEVVGIKGESMVGSLAVKDVSSGSLTEIPVNGVFVEIGRMADTDIFKDLVERDERGQIIVDETMRTSMPGVFAAGDVTDKAKFKQITIAMGQATTAALCAYQHLQLKQGGSGHVPLDRVVGAC